MRNMSLPTPRSFLVALAALAIALTGAACSAEGGAGEGSVDEREAARAGSQAEPVGRGAGPEASPARVATAEFRVQGMTCGGCALATEMAVKKLDGVESADAEYDEATGEGRCTVEYDPDRVTTDRMAAAMEEAGFTPRLQSTDASS